jgi:predicted RNA binding protein YcfA (HicA-like mRNA interferase family)
MSHKIPVITARKLVRALKQAGFVEDRQKGSHLTLINPETNKTITIPVHTGTDIGKGLLKNIITASGLTIDEFIDLL